MILVTFIAFISIMASGTCCLMHIDRVTGLARSPAMIDPASSFICYGRMGHIEGGRDPRSGGMAGRTIRAKGACMESRVAVTRSAVYSYALELSIGMTLRAWDSGMTAGEREIRAVVVE
jgi:hypothetical protein